MTRALPASGDVPHENASVVEQLDSLGYAGVPFAPLEVTPMGDASSRGPVSLPALDPGTVPAQTGSRYPESFRGLVGERSRRALGDALGLRSFGVNLTRLEPGAWSALRHWHTRQDEFVYVLMNRD